MAVRKSKIAVSGPVAPAFKGHQRRPEWQTGRAGVFLGGQYPITVYYVNSRSVFRQGWTLAPGGARVNVRFRKSSRIPAKRFLLSGGKLTPLRLVDFVSP